MSKLALTLVAVATQEIGTQEVNGSNCGPRVNEYKAATNLPPAESWPWCAAFVDWCVREAMRLQGVAETPTFHRPTTAGAWDLINWSLAQDESTETKHAPGMDIRAGDILVYTFSHVGIAAADARDWEVDTIEGNTDVAGSREGGGVFKKTRRVDLVKARLRFTL